MSSWQIKRNNYRMVIFTWFLIFVPPLEWKIRHLFMNKSTCVKVVGSSTICQGTYEESCPSGHLAISRQILGVDCGTKREANLQPLLLQLGKNLNCWPGQIPTDEREIYEVQPSWREIPACHWCYGDGKNNFNRAALSQRKTI